MNTLFRRLYYQQEGQALYLVAALLIVLLGSAALSIDIGILLHAQRELQASADAAATAAAQDLSNLQTADYAINTAYCYSGVGTSGFGGSRDCPNGQTVSSGLNTNADLPGVTMVSPYPQVKCLQTMVNLGLTCTSEASANAIAVEEQVTVPTFFAKVFGITSVTLTAQALSAMKGGSPVPANIMVIVDTTHSMQDQDTTGNCTIPNFSGSPTKEDCAKYGVATLLSGLSPCAAGLSSCGTITNGNVANPVQQAGLLVFPGLTSTSLDPDDYACQTTQLTVSGGGLAPYALPASNPPYFTIVQPSSDYRTSDSSGLNGATSDLVKAVDWQDGNSCTSSAYGLEDHGGVGTYYAGVITEAQNDLSALTGARARMQNLIILLSDGDANASSSDFTSASLTSQPNLNVDECQQAVTAAQNVAATTNAAGLKTWVFSVAYGSSTIPYSGGSGSCQTDNPPISASPSAYNTGCATMAAIASDPNYFFSDDSAGCVSPAHPSTPSLSSIFKNILYYLQTTRLLPWSTT